MIEPRPAGFWIRALAALIDFAIFALVQFSLGYIGASAWGPDIEKSAAFKPMVTLFTVVFAGAYTTLLHALGGQTIGKMIVGVKVAAAAGEPPPLGTALLRYLAYFASAGIFTLGFVMAGLRHDKRALHDLIAGTRVERLPRAAPPAPAEPPPVPAQQSTAGAA